MTLLERWERQAVILGDTRVLEDVIDLARMEGKSWGSRRRGISGPVAAGTQYYQDTRPPFATAAYPTVTLATTSKMLVPTNPNTAVQPVEWYAGKIFHYRAFGQFTSGATPTSITLEIRLATADNAGVLLASSAALTWIASQVNMSWRTEFYVQCWSTGSGGASGSLAAAGVFECNPAAVAAAQGMIPATAPAAVTADLSTASGISFQAKRAGSTAETMQVFQQVFAALN